MKYRSDFVTNSSSSSFIVVFRSKEEYEKRLDIMLARNIDPQYACQIYQDTGKYRVSKVELLKRVREEFNMYAEFKLLYSNDTGYRSYGDIERYRKSEKYKIDLNNMIKEEMRKFESNLPKRGYYGIVEYGDEDSYGSALEHDIMPYLPFTVQVFNHH